MNKINLQRIPPALGPFENPSLGQECAALKNLIKRGYERKEDILDA